MPEPYYAKVESLWDELETRFGLNGIRVTPYPHFSWNIAEEYDRPQMDWAVAETGTGDARFQRSDQRGSASSLRPSPSCSLRWCEISFC